LRRGPGTQVRLRGGRPRGAPPLAALAGKTLQATRLCERPLHRALGGRSDGFGRANAPRRGGPAVTGRLVAREELTPAEQDSLFALLSAHFRGLTRERFAADLAEKNWILLL